MKNIKHYVYETVSWKGGELDLKRCAKGIYGERGNHHQCNKNIVETIEGYGFCFAHAKQIKIELGLITTGKIIYYTNMSYDEPVLAELLVESETESTINILEVKNILGKTYTFSKGKSKKHSEYTRGCRYFENLKDAVSDLIERSQNLEEVYENKVNQQREITKNILEFEFDIDS